MESLTISLKEIFRKGIPNSKIQSVCQFSDADYLMCTKNQVFHFSAFKDSGNNLSKLNYAFKTSIFIKDLNIICAISSSLPNIVFISTRWGFPLICEAYRLSSTLYDTIQYSPKSRKLIVSGDSVEIFDLIIEWKLFEIDPMITLVNKLSFSCERMTSNIYLDEMRQILIIPSLFGISTVDMSNLKGSPNYNLEHAVSFYQLGNIPFQTMAFYNSQKISKKRSISNIPFKNLITTNSNGDISLWNSSSIKKGYPIQNFKKLNEVSILCEFVDNEFCIFVTENTPNYFVILFDIKTGKTIKLTSFDTKVIKMNILSKKSVSFLTEEFYVVYQLNIPWHLFSKTASNAVAIRRYPTFSFHAKAARVATLFNDGIVSLFSPDVHFLLTEIGTTCSSRIIDFIYDRSSSLRIRDKVISLNNVCENDFQFFNTSKKSNSDLNSNLAASNYEPNKIVSFEFAEDDSLIANKTQTQTQTSLQNEDSQKNVNFLISLIQLRKKKELRKFMEIGERFIFLLDDGTVQVFNSDNDRFTLSKSITSMNLLSFALTYIREESDNGINNFIPTFIGFNKEGELLSFRFDNFEVLSRTAVTTNVSKGRVFPLFVCIHHRSNLIYAIYENQILVIDSSTKKVIQTDHLNSKPKYASLEDDLLLIVYENRVIQIRHLNNDQTHPITESIKLLENVTFAIVQYETFIIVTDDKTVRIGHTFDNCAIFEFPFKIFSAGFLNPDLDLALGLDYEVMVIRRSIWYPFIEKTFNCTNDTSDPKTENYITQIHDKAVLYNIKDEKEKDKEKIDINSDNLTLSSYSSYSSSSSSSLQTNNLLDFVTQKVHNSQVSFDLAQNSNVKIISHHKSSPNIVKLAPNQNKHANFAPDGSSSPLNRMKKLPDLRTNDEMMNNAQFMALFKDVGSGLNDGTENKRRTSIFTGKKKADSETEPKNEEKNTKNSSFEPSNNTSNKTKTSKSAPRSKNSQPTNEIEDEDEIHHQKRIKKKKKVTKKCCNDDTNNTNDDDVVALFNQICQKETTQSHTDGSQQVHNEKNDIKSPHLRPRPPSSPSNSSSPNPRNQASTFKPENSRIDTESKIEVSDQLGSRSNDNHSPVTDEDQSQSQSSFTKMTDKPDLFYESKSGNEDCSIKKSHSQLPNGSEFRNEQKSDTDSKSNVKNDEVCEPFCSDKEQTSYRASFRDDNSKSNEVDSVIQAEISETKSESETKPVSSVLSSTSNNKEVTETSDLPQKARSFIKLGTKNSLTMSSPDLVLLQSHLGNVKLTAKKRKEKNDKKSGTFDFDFDEDKKELPLITVHLIQKKTISRTKSEYSIIRCIDQTIFEARGDRELGVVGMQAMKLATKTKTADQAFVVENGDESRVEDEDNKKKKLRSELVSIRPLFLGENQQQKKKSMKQTKNGSKRLDFVVPKRTDRQPLGNVELAIQVFHSNAEKK